MPFHGKKPWIEYESMPQLNPRHVPRKDTVGKCQSHALTWANFIVRIAFRNRIERGFPTKPQDRKSSLSM